MALRRAYKGNGGQWEGVSAGAAATLGLQGPPRAEQRGIEVGQLEQLEQLEQFEQLEQLAPTGGTRRQRRGVSRG